MRGWWSGRPPPRRRGEPLAVGVGGGADDVRRPADQHGVVGDRPCRPGRGALPEDAAVAQPARASGWPRCRPRTGRRPSGPDDPGAVAEHRPLADRRPAGPVSRRAPVLQHRRVVAQRDAACPGPQHDALRQQGPGAEVRLPDRSPRRPPWRRVRPGPVEAHPSTSAGPVDCYRRRHTMGSVLPTVVRISVPRAPPWSPGLLGDLGQLRRAASSRGPCSVIFRSIHRVDRSVPGQSGSTSWGRRPSWLVPAPACRIRWSTGTAGSVRSGCSCSPGVAPCPAGRSGRRCSPPHPAPGGRGREYLAPVRPRECRPQRGVRDDRPQEQFTELTRRTQENFKHLWEQWSQRSNELLKGVGGRSRSAGEAPGNPEEVLDAVFDFAENLIAQQRAFAKQMLRAASGASRPSRTPPVLPVSRRRRPRPRPQERQARRRSPAPPPTG